MKSIAFVRITMFITVLLFQSFGALAQGVVVKDISARPGDVSTPDGLMDAFYAVVNIAPNEARQWDRDKTLYAPWIRFVATSTDAKGQVKTRVWTHQQYVEATEPLVKSGFKEWEIARKIKVYGNIAHIDSTYMGELTADGKVERFRGVNSIEAYFDGTRWWISSVIWMSESPNHPIPPEYLAQQ
ncbi:hypothetical protein [Rheinheimera sp. 4Y26]|uniref:hypothetical protein n=1 Tax=Rheinheimera sp. 4Y26 TaxID=2977811 RepID=UPI0021B13CC7|nr:hypothetical protein [Rheinheimera sp. 4Y26]MCT6698152.1 hypothetical protein [Rheinheimera sp. 4Y26]